VSLLALIEQVHEHEHEHVYVYVYVYVGTASDAADN
jgi:hypothetical protein